MWKGEICKRCERRNVVGFNIEQSVWDTVVKGRWNILCLTCFDEEAEIAGIVYSVEELYPVSWSQWSETLDGLQKIHIVYEKGFKKTLDYLWREKRQ